MRLKKNPENDINRKRDLYFILGLFVVLVLTYSVLEWKTEDDNGGFDTGEFPNGKVAKKKPTVILETKAKFKETTNSTLETKVETIKIAPCGYEPAKKN